jgi:hypothetical protein
MDVCSLSIEAKKSIIFCCLFCGGPAPAMAVCCFGCCCAFPVSELNGFVGSGRFGAAVEATIFSVPFVTGPLVPLPAFTVPALTDLPLSLPSKYCRLFFSKSGSLRYSSNACVKPVGAYISTLQWIEYMFYVGDLKKHGVFEGFCFGKVFYDFVGAFYEGLVYS